MEEWKQFLIRSIGFEPASLTPRAQDVLLLRMIPFVERNYNTVELGPRGTGKSHLFQQISPYSHLVSGGKATVARMFVNNANGQRGLVCQYDVVCFDEVSGVSFDQKDGVNIMKGYMESGEFSRGKESIRADGGVVMVGNFDVDGPCGVATTYVPPPPTPPTPPTPPANTFKVKKVKKQPKFGRATIVIKVPGVGVLDISGKGVVKRKKRTVAAGKVKVTLKTKGKLKKGDLLCFLALGAGLKPGVLLLIT